MLAMMQAQNLVPVLHIPLVLRWQGLQRIGVVGTTYRLAEISLIILKSFRNRFIFVFTLLLSLLPPLCLLS